MQGARAGLQLLFTIIPILVGAAIGGGAGYVYARMLRPMIRSHQKVRRGLMLFPWRSVIVMLPYLGFFIPMFTGLGVTSGAFFVGIFVVLFSMPFTTNTLLNAWFPLPLRIRMLALARTISVAAISVAAASGIIGGFSAGRVMLQALQLLQYADFFNMFFIVFVIALLVDVLFGVTQYIIYRPPAPSG